MPTFGQTIRGMRLGYRWSDKHQTMVRISDCGPHFEVRLCPPDQLPKGHWRGENKEHRCWWEKKDGAGGVELLDMIAPMRQIKAVKQPIRFVVDNDGLLVGQPGGGAR